MSSVRDEILKETEGLPEGILRQILQFVRFLRSGRSSGADELESDAVEYMDREVDEFTKRRLVDQALRAEEEIKAGKWLSPEEARNQMIGYLRK
ncbi:MAG: hypothetical protein KBF73_07405 [Flavobacteriales bacterium]|nr:hypothetical protein [Flavobacteriales bacterium]